MEEGVAQVKFAGMGDDGEVSGDGDSECETTRAMVLSHNRKGKKSGGFQSMGNIITWSCIDVAMYSSF